MTSDSEEHAVVLDDLVKSEEDCFMANLHYSNF